MGSILQSKVMTPVTLALALSGLVRAGSTGGSQCMRTEAGSMGRRQSGWAGHGGQGLFTSIKVLISISAGVAVSVHVLTHWPGEVRQDPGQTPHLENIWNRPLETQTAYLPALHHLPAHHGASLHG